MSETITQTTQDYLKAIYDLSTQDGLACTSAMAERLGIAPASVTGMLQRLANLNPPLIIYRKHFGVILTPEGERAALEVIRRHRLIESYLHQSLGYAWDEVHDEADRLEHAISQNFEARIAKALGEPQRDPHGEPIPSVDLVMPPDETTPLSEVRPPHTAIIRSVRSGKPALLRHLEELGLLPGVLIETLDYSEFDRNLQLLVGRQAQPIVLGQPVTEQIFVEVIK
jgi:DtxR family Mn-dependent transcriptional regulator